MDAFVNIRTDGIRRNIKRAQKFFSKKEIELKVANVIVRCVKTHYRETDRKRSRFGHKFYIKHGEKQVRLSDSDQDKFIIRAGDRLMSHKFFGGVVKPKNSKHIAIPLSDKAKEIKYPRKVRQNKYSFLVPSGKLLLYSADRSYRWLLKEEVRQRGFRKEVSPAENYSTIKKIKLAVNNTLVKIINIATQGFGKR